jgi:predicted amidohydrolase YtcJ
MGMRVTFHVVNGLGRSQGDTFVESEVATDFGDDWLRVGGYKVMVDGSSSGPTAGTREPYTSQPGFSGQVLPSQDQLNAMFEAAHRRGFQLTMHGVGDRAVEMGLTAMERAFELAGPPRRRPRIEHCAMVPDDLMPRLKRIGLIPIPQPYFIFEFGDGYLRNYGEGRGGAMFPIGSFLRAGILVAAGSDSPVSALQPLKGIQAAAQRFTQDGQTCGAEERINAAQCLPLYTINGAHAVGMGDRLGSISTGKLADLTVLAADPRAVAVDELAAIPVDITMVGGVIRHVR